MYRHEVVINSDCEYDVIQLLVGYGCKGVVTMQGGYSTVENNGAWSSVGTESVSIIRFLYPKPDFVKCLFEEIGAGIYDYIICEVLEYCVNDK